jgi:hypothetical protein
MHESEKERDDPVSEINIQGRCKTKVAETKDRILSLKLTITICLFEQRSFVFLNEN